MIKFLFFNFVQARMILNWGQSKNGSLVIQDLLAVSKLDSESVLKKMNFYIPTQVQNITFEINFEMNCR